jgi:hypothetical protein
METKLIEVRDAATCIVMAAIKMEPFKDNALNKYPILWRDKSGTVSTMHARETWMLSHAGYGFENPLILFFRIDQPSKWKWSSMDWDPNLDRTFAVTHRYLEDHWDEVKHGDVIDAQFILGETAVQKRTDQFWFPGSPLPPKPDTSMTPVGSVEERIAELKIFYGEDNVWTAEELDKAFVIESFSPPFCLVVRRTDQVRGFVAFEKEPRCYYDFKIYLGEDGLPQNTEVLVDPAPVEPAPEEPMEPTPEEPIN